MNVRNPKRLGEVFSYSFLDIMTTLLIVGLVLLFSTTVLFSVLPFNDRLLEQSRTRAEEDVIRLRNAINTLRDQLNLVDTEFATTIGDAARLADDWGMSPADLANVPSQNLNASETAELRRLAAEAARLPSLLLGLQDEVVSGRRQYEARRQEWLDELIVSAVTDTNRTALLPELYIVGPRGSLRLGSSNVGSLHDAVVNNANGGRYPIFVVLPEGFGFWVANHRPLERLADSLAVPFGYEPFSSRLRVLDEIFDLAVVR